MLALGATALGVSQTGGSGDNSPDVLEVRYYVLTLDKAQKTATAMPTISQLVAENPGLNAALDASSGSTGKKPLTQQGQDIDAHFPQLAAIIRTNGLATREFIVLTGSIMSDIGRVTMKKGGMVQAYPAGMITPENATLIEGNWPALQMIAAKMTPPNVK
jgi:hypothetical protein